MLISGKHTRFNRSWGAFFVVLKRLENNIGDMPKKGGEESRRVTPFKGRHLSNDVIGSMP